MPTSALGKAALKDDADVGPFKRYALGLGRQPNRDQGGAGGEAGRDAVVWGVGAVGAGRSLVAAEGVPAGGDGCGKRAPLHAKAGGHRLG